jgi:iron(III) transport system substrate-binding protein
MESELLDNVASDLEAATASGRERTEDVMRKHISRRRFVVGAGALSILGASGIHGVAARQDLATPAVDFSGGEVNLYSSRHYDTDQALYDGFTELTGARVNLIEAEADELIERIKAEGANSPADVLLTVDAGRLWRAQQEGLLQPVTSDILAERVPENLRDPDGHWFGFSQRARVLVYARDRVDPAQLSTYEALSDPAWDDAVLVRSSSNVYNQSLVGALIAEHGEAAIEEWARGIVANMARPPEGGDTDQIKAVAAGEGDVAIANHYYYMRLLNSDDAADQEVAEATAVFFPNQGPDERGVHVNISGGGVVATAPHPEAALAFLEYLTSPLAQEEFALGNYEYPAVAGVPLDPALETLGPFTADPLNAAVYGENNERALLLMIRAGWE